MPALVRACSISLTPSRGRRESLWMVDKNWRNRGGTLGIGEVLDRGPTRKLFGQQQLWRQLVGRTLGELTATLGVNAAAELRIMAGNDAARREVLARDSHILAAWNAVARQRGTPEAQTLVCWVNTRVGRKVRPRVQTVQRVPDVPRKQPPAPVEHASGPETSDPDLSALLGRIRARIEVASREGGDPA